MYQSLDTPASSGGLLHNFEEGSDTNVFNHPSTQSNQAYQEKRMMEFDDDLLDSRIRAHAEFNSSLFPMAKNILAQQTKIDSSLPTLDTEIQNQLPFTEDHNNFKVQDWNPDNQDLQEHIDSSDYNDHPSNPRLPWQEVVEDQLQQQSSTHRYKNPICKKSAKTLLKSTVSQTNNRKTRSSQTTVTFANNSKDKDASRYSTLHSALNQLESMGLTNTKSLNYTRKVAKERQTILQDFNVEVAELNKQEASKIYKLYCREKPSPWD